LISFSKEKLKIMIKKKVMRIRPSTTLNATDGRTGWRYVRTFDQVLEYHASPFCAAGALADVSPAVEVALVLTAAGGTAQPAAMKSALVKSSGAATNSSTLKIKAKIIEPIAALVPPFFSSSFERCCVGTGNNPGTAPVRPAKSPSPSITAGVRAISTSSVLASSASANASFAELFSAF